MKDKIANITRWILILLLAVSVISGVVFYVLYDFGRVQAALLEDIDNQYLLMFTNWSVILLGLTVFIAIASPIYGIISNPQNLVKLLISLGLIVVIVFIGYSMAGDAVTETQEVKFGLTQTSSKMVGTGLYVTYIAFGLTVLSLLYSSVVKLFK